MFRKVLILPFALCGVMSANAFDIGTITFDNPPTGSGVNGFRGTVNGVSVGGFAGLLNVTETDLTNPGNSLGPIFTLCAELTSTDLIVTPVEIFDPTSTFGNPDLTAAGNIMANVAGLFGGSLATLNNDQAFALQLDVWEAIYDGTSEAAPEFSTGHFQTGNTKSAADNLITAAVLADADQFWAFRNEALDSIFFEAAGSGVTDTRGQNMLTVRSGGRRIFTPEPVSMSLGFAGIGLFLRRRKGKLR